MHNVEQDVILFTLFHKAHISSLVILVVVLTHWSILVPSLGSCFKSLFAIACMTINCQPKLYNQDSPISHNEFLLFFMCFFRGVFQL